MQTQEQPKRYFLFSITMMVDGIRTFHDMAICAHRFKFPSKFELFTCYCEMCDLDVTNEEFINSFSILNIYEFQYKEEYDQYLMNFVEETEDNQTSEPVIIDKTLLN